MFRLGHDWAFTARQVSSSGFFLREAAEKTKLDDLGATRVDLRQFGQASLSVRRSSEGASAGPSLSSIESFTCPPPLMSAWATRAWSIRMRDSC